MKIRKGFVSNSSSTSFVIAYKEGLAKEKLAQILREKVCGYTEVEIFSEILKHNGKIDFDIYDVLADILMDSDDKEFDKYDYDYADKFENLKNRGFVVKEGVSDDHEYDLSSMIDRCHLNIKLDDKENEVYIDLCYNH